MTATEELGRVIAKAGKHYGDTGATASGFRSGTITKLNSDGTIDVLLDSGQVLPGLAAISKHVKELGRKVAVGMNGAEPVVLTADLIAAGTVVAGMLIAEFELVVGQVIRSAGYQQGVAGWAIKSDGNAEFNNVAARGMFQSIGGPELLPNPTVDADVLGYVANTGSIALETTTTDSSPGSLKHTTPASASQTWVEDAAFMPITLDALYKATTRVRPNATGDKVKVGLRFYQADGTFITETSSAEVTGFTTFQDLPSYGIPPSALSGVKTYRPKEDVDLGGNLVNLFYVGAGLGAGWSTIDETVLDASDYIGHHAGDPSSYTARFNNVSGDFTGKTIDSVTLVAQVARGFTNAWIDPTALIGGTFYTAASVPITVAGDGSVQTVKKKWTKNPATNLAWTPADIDSFRQSAGTNSLGWILESDFDDVAIYQGWVEVAWHATTAPTQMKRRLYVTPATASGTIAYWDNMSLKQQPTTSGVGQQKIGEIILPGTAASVTLPVPPGFPNLHVKCMARGTVAAANGDLRMRFNGDATTNAYLWQAMESNGTNPVGGGGSAGDTSLFVGYVPGTTSAAADAAPTVIDIPSANGTTFYKSFTAEGGLFSTNDRDINVSTGKWVNTAAITSITLLPSSGSFAAGSHFQLFGEP